MCNLYSETKGQEAIRTAARVMRDVTGNPPTFPGIFPDYSAPIVRNAPDGVRELSTARWGMPSSQFALMESAKKRAAKLEAKGKPVDFKELLRMEPDIGTTNIRNLSSKHWRRWLGVENRCVVPFTSFSENEVLPDGSRPPAWFAFDESRPLAFFAGIWTRWTSVRKVKEGETTNDLFAFLTTEPNAVGRDRDLVDCAGRRSAEASATVARRRAAHRRARREGRSRAGPGVIRHG